MPHINLDISSILRITIYNENQRLSFSVMQPLIIASFDHRQQGRGERKSEGQTRDYMSGLQSPHSTMSCGSYLPRAKR